MFTEGSLVRSSNWRLPEPSTTATSSNSIVTVILSPVVYVLSSFIGGYIDHLRSDHIRNISDEYCACCFDRIVRIILDYRIDSHINDLLALKSNSGSIVITVLSSLIVALKLKSAPDALLPLSLTSDAYISTSYLAIIDLTHPLIKSNGNSLLPGIFIDPLLGLKVTVGLMTSFMLTVALALGAKCQGYLLVTEML